MNEITRLLREWSQGDKEALDRIVPLVDEELRKIAHSYLRKERAGHILQTTALVNEALLKVIPADIPWENRKHFYALLAKRMGQVLIDYARKAGKAEFVDIDEATLYTEKSKEVLLLEAGLTKLAKIDERKVRVVECRHFIGLTIPETAAVLGVASKTVERDWDFAQAWLKREMTE